MSALREARSALQFRPLSPAVGAEVIGLDLSRGVSDADADALRAAYRRHHLLLARGQHPTTALQTAFAGIFGRVTLREKNTVRNVEENAQHVSNVRDDGLFGKGELDFHLDQLFQPEPLSALILTALEVPEEGGDTLFVNAMAAVEAMPAALRARIADLRCLNAYTFAGVLAKDWNVKDSAVAGMAQEHPMLWRDPESGRHALWVNKLTTVGVVGLGPEEGAALIAEVRSYL
ncbi:MAG TPA: TauD/TfdA family dioxygenase, partial [Acetobacteraceae bacterium]|nr:TauD/TfdA family dioxygenase [Acetobacteraceae bacterium]